MKVLRHGPDDILVVVDGEGNWYQVRVLETGKTYLQGVILEHRKEVGEPRYHLTLGLALLKQMARFEWALEKAVELGVREIIPLRTEHTERTVFKRERLQRVLIAAMKQCGRSRLPHLRDPVALKSLLQEPLEGKRYMAHEKASEGMLDTFRKAENPQKLCVLVGPEGGFSKGEVQLASQQGWELVALGYRRLRAETAAVAVAAGVMLFNEALRSYEQSETRREDTGE